MVLLHTVMHYKVNYLQDTVRYSYIYKKKINAVLQLITQVVQFHIFHWAGSWGDARAGACARVLAYYSLWRFYRTRIRILNWRSIVDSSNRCPYFPSFKASWFVVPKSQLRRMALPPPTRYWPWEGLRRWESVIQPSLQRPRHWLKEWIPTKSVQWIRANSAWDHQLSTSPLQAAPWRTWRHKVGWVWSIEIVRSVIYGRILWTFGELRRVLWRCM